MWIECLHCGWNGEICPETLQDCPECENDLAIEERAEEERKELNEYDGWLKWSTK